MDFLQCNIWNYRNCIKPLLLSPLDAYLGTEDVVPDLERDGLYLDAALVQETRQLAAELSHVHDHLGSHLDLQSHHGLKLNTVR